MLGLRRRRARSHAQLMRDELGVSFDHFLQAATHAAGGVGATVGPRVSSAREIVAPGMTRMRGVASDGWGATVATLAPLTTAAKDGAREARRAQEKAMKGHGRSPSRSRWPMLVGLLAVGAAVGAGAAFVIRRRRKHQWEEYDPSRGATSGQEDAASMLDTARQKAGNATHRVADASAETARAMADRTSAAADKAAGRVSSAADQAASKVSSAADRAKSSADDLVGKVGTPSKNSRS